MIIKNQTLIDKVIDVLRYDQEDRRPLQCIIINYNSIFIKT